MRSTLLGFVLSSVLMTSAAHAEMGTEVPKPARAVHPKLDLTLGSVFTSRDVFVATELRGKLLLGGVFYGSIFGSAWTPASNREGRGALTAGAGVGLQIPLSVRWFADAGVDYERMALKLYDKVEGSNVLRGRVALGWHFQDNGAFIFGAGARMIAMGESNQRTFPEIFIGAEGF
jgi:hypothetical protein